MRKLNFWFDLPSALMGVFFLTGGAILAWKAAHGDEPFDASAATTIGLCLLLAAAGFWMSAKLGETQRKRRTRRKRKPAPPPAPRVESADQPTKCPRCGHSPVAEILFGLVAITPEIQADLDAGTLALGGCDVTSDDPEWRCTSCGCEIHRAQDVKSDRCS
jgi:hypothetical protein